MLLKFICSFFLDSLIPGALSHVFQSCPFVLILMASSPIGIHKHAYICIYVYVYVYVYDFWARNLSFSCPSVKFVAIQHL